MTGNDVPTSGGLPPDPPWPVDLLADLHAGVLDPPDADELSRRVESDPDARATLAALDATQRALAELPRPRMPEDVAARIDAAIAREAAARAAGGPAGPPTKAGGEAAVVATGTPSVPAVNLATERARRRRLLAGAGILAAAATIAVFTVVNLTGSTTDGQPNAGTSPSDTRFETSTGPLALSSNNLGDALKDAFGATEYGLLGSADKLAGCLSANGVDPGATVPLGAKQVTFDGKPGVLIVLPAGSNPPKWRLLVVSPDCGPGNPAMLADTTIG